MVAAAANERFEEKKSEDYDRRSFLEAIIYKSTELDVVVCVYMRVCMCARVYAALKFVNFFPVIS